MQTQRRLDNFCTQFPNSKVSCVAKRGAHPQNRNDGGKALLAVAPQLCISNSFFHSVACRILLRDMTVPNCEKME